MGKRNKHQTNRANGIAYQYMHEVLGPWIPCPKRKCEGTLQTIYAQYERNEPPCKEQICTLCGKVVRNPADIERRRKKYKQSGNKHWPSYRDRGYNKTNNSSQRSDYATHSNTARSS